MHDPIKLKDHQQESKLVNRRLIACGALVALMSVTLVARMYFLQVTDYATNATVSENNRIHVLPIPPERGLIFDRNGKVLAENLPSFNLTLTRERAGNSQAVLDQVTDILQLSPEQRLQCDKALKKSRHPFEPVTLLHDLSEEQIALIEVNRYKLPGIDVDAEFVRHYPYGEHFAHSVGFVGRINEREAARLDSTEYRGTEYIGKTGIEHFYEPQLHGHVGYEEVETNAQGRVMRVLKKVPPVAGENIVLGLDVDLQVAAEKALGDRRGSVVALDPNTGQVLAMVSNPSFDPNLFVNGISSAQYAQLRDSIDRPLYNRVLRGLYPPGSTVKPAVALAGLDAGVVTPTSRVFDPGYYQLPNYDHKYRNWNRYGDGWVSLESAIYRSNDTYFYDLAHKLGIDRLHAFMSRFGFGQKVALDMFGEADGLMPSREWKRKTRRQVWYPGETLILGIGQGYMQATPIQLAQMTALLANKGHWIRPHLAKTIDGQPPVDPDPMPDIVLRDPANWDRVDYGMQQVVHGARGTARKVGATSAYLIAGKSGTAQVVAIKQNERYDRSKLLERHRDHALFVGFAPANNPQIAVAVMVENGESGSGVAAPVVKQVMDAWLLDEHGKLKAEYAEPVAPLAAAVAKPEPTAAEPEAPALEQ